MTIAKANSGLKKKKNRAYIGRKSLFSKETAVQLRWGNLVSSKLIKLQRLVEFRRKKNCRASQDLWLSGPI